MSSGFGVWPFHYTGAELGAGRLVATSALCERKARSKMRGEINFGDISFLVPIGPLDPPCPVKQYKRTRRTRDA